MNLLIAFLSGLIFAVGLGVSGMTDPKKVQAFLDIFGDWDPSLAFVMVGAISVHMAFYRFIIKRPSPILDSEFHLPKSSKISKRLIFGAMIFGLGWGMSGLCPGPAITSLAGLGPKTMIFVAFMALGALISNKIAEKLN